MSNLAEPAKWALLIGINAYPNFDEYDQLDGCVNDINVISGILTEVFGFAEGDVTILTDEAATRAGILTAMEELLECVRDDDVVILYYSGHGSRMKDRDGDEEDGYDETLVPHDSGRGEHPNRDITDDEIHEWLQRLTARTSQATLIFDCCHSGTIDRDIFEPKRRSVKIGDRSVEKLPPTPVTGPTIRSTANDVGPSGWFPHGERHVLLAACRDTEKSYEYTHPESGVTHGKMTFFLAQALWRAKSGITYADLFEQICPHVSSDPFWQPQHPQLEGPHDRKVFGTAEIEPMRFVAITQRDLEAVQVAAGSAHGLTAGSTWSIYPPGTKTVGNNPDRIGLLEITKVGAATSSARIVEENRPEAITAGCRTMEKAHTLRLWCLRVSVQEHPEFESEAENLRELFDDSSLLQSVAQNEPADVRVSLVSPGNSAAENNPVPQLGPFSEPQWVVVGKDGRLLLPTYPANSIKVRTIRDNVEKLARYQSALALINPDPNNSLCNAIEVHLKCRSTNGDWRMAEPAAQGEPIFEEGEQLGVSILNHHAAPVYLHLMDFGIAWGIELVPYSSANEILVPGAELEIGMREDEQIILKLPDGFPIVSDPAGKIPAQGVETLKIFVTNAPVDLSMLRQSPIALRLDVRPNEAQTETSLQDLPHPEELISDVDWTVVSRPFFLRRSASELRYPTAG